MAGQYLVPGGSWVEAPTSTGEVLVPGQDWVSLSDTPAPQLVSASQLIPAFTQLVTISTVTASDTDAAGVYRPFILVEIELWQ